MCKENERSPDYLKRAGAKTTILRAFVYGGFPQIAEELRTLEIDLELAKNQSNHSFEEVYGLCKGENHGLHNSVFTELVALLNELSSQRPRAHLLQLILEGCLERMSLQQLQDVKSEAKMQLKEENDFVKAVRPLLVKVSPIQTDLPALNADDISAAVQQP